MGNISERIKRNTAYEIFKDISCIFNTIEIFLDYFYTHFTPQGKINLTLALKNT